MPTKRLINTMSLLMLTLPAAVNAENLDCSNIPQWHSGGTYSENDEVQLNDRAYRAKWWTQSNPELNSGQWDVWVPLGQCGTSQPNLPPSVTITSPLSGSFLQKNDNAVITTETSDSDGTVTKVIYYAGNQQIGSDDTAPFAYSWTPTEVGEFQLTAVATDDDGAETTSAVVNVTVEADQSNNITPIANINVELPNAIYVGDSLTLGLTGSDSDGQVVSLTLQENGQNIYSTNAAQASYQWNATTAGVYEFQLIATDNQQAEGQSPLLSITVKDPDVVVGDRNQCQPTGLYQTPEVNTPYCTVYDEQGREIISPDHPRRIIGYFTSWRNGANGQPTYLVNDIPWQKITHINYAFAHIDGQNKISIGNPNSASNPATNMEWPGVEGAEMDPAYNYKGHFNLLNKYKKQYPHVKTLISVGGWAETGGYFDATGRVNSGGFYTMTTNADGSINHTGINDFSTSVVAFLREYGFDGADIDYEYPSSMTDSGHPDDFEFSNPRRAALNASYQVLMKTLREELDKAGQADGKHYMLTIAAPSSGYLLRGMETFQVTQYLDYVNIMSYDLHGAWNSHVGPNAPLYDTGEDSELAVWDVYNTAEFEGIGYLNTDWSVRYFRGAMSAGRINIGIPYYTRGFKDVEGGQNGLWGQAKFPDQSNCPKGTGKGDKNFCGNGAVGIDNLWHDIENDREVPAGSNPLWHVKNLQAGKLGSYLQEYGLDPANDPQDALTGTYQRFYEQTAIAPWLWNADKKVYLSIEDEESMATKVDYVIDQGLGGVMFWELAGDFDYDSVKQEYFMGSTMTGIAYDKFKQSGRDYDTHRGDVNYVVPAEAVDVSFVVKDFPVGDDNYPIAPTFSFTNNSNIDLSGAKISFDVPVATSAIFKSNWNAQKKLKLTVENNGSNAAGNNIGGFENEFHRFAIELVDEWGNVTESFKPGETVNVPVMYYMPITGPANFTISKGTASYAFKFEQPTLPDATGDSGGGDGSDNGGNTCGDLDVSALPAYPDFPHTDWQGNPSHALTGDQMIHNQAVWQAKWWTNKEPSEGDWTFVCNL